MTCSSHSTGPLVGLRVLLVEDEFLIALEIEELLKTFGCTVVGPVPDFHEALQAARSGGFDMAVMDINLNGQDVYPVVDLLLERRIPFLLATGYMTNNLPDCYRHLPHIQKPLDGSQLRERLLDLLEQG